MASQPLGADKAIEQEEQPQQQQRQAEYGTGNDRQQAAVVTNQVGQLSRQRLSKLLQLHGYSACREALVLIDDHYNSRFHHYESIEDFISTLNRIITFDSGASSSIIDPDLAHLAIEKLSNLHKRQLQHQSGDTAAVAADGDEELVDLEPQLPTELTVRLKNVFSDQPTTSDKALGGDNQLARLSTGKQADEFNIHYNFLLKRLNSLPIFQGDFKLMNLSTLTASSQPSIRCICFGLLIKDIYKIDGYLLIDSTGRVPVRITPDTAFRNKLAYTNCIVLIEGIYVNPDDVLFAANIGLPPILLDPMPPKSLACAENKSIVILKELYLDDEDVCKALERLFDHYNGSANPPMMFILIGDFTRDPCVGEQFQSHTKKLVRIIRTCDNLKKSHFVFVPGLRDTCPLETLQDPTAPQSRQMITKMPKPPLTKEQIPVNLLALSHFENVHLASNPSHIYLGERQISVVSHSYLKELSKNLLHDLSDRLEEFFDTSRQIMLSNAHMSAGISKNIHSSMNLWHRPDLLILADTEARSAKYNYSTSSDVDTSFSIIPSFTRQFSKYKTYYIQTGKVEDSQITSRMSSSRTEIPVTHDVVDLEAND